MTQNRAAQDGANLILTGFMGTGKTTVGRIMAHRLGRPFVDTDVLIEGRAGETIPDIFRLHGEQAFRDLEAAVCRELSDRRDLVIATGGGMLLDESNRRLMESSGLVVCLMATAESVIERLAGSQDRPLLNQPNPVEAARRILDRRKAVYGSFPWRVDTAGRTPDGVADDVQCLWDARRLTVRQPAGAGAYPIVIRHAALPRLGRLLAGIGRRGMVAVVSNPTVWSLFGETVQSSLTSNGFAVASCLIPDGEAWKTLDTVASLYACFLDAGLDRGGTVLALGGGVVGDVAGFAAATYMRGIPVVQAPTTLLAMIDSAVGGKTGVDLPRGKNLVGAFHNPSLVVIDPDALQTLPAAQLRCGLAEALKAGVIADPALFDLLRSGPPWDWSDIVERALSVKVTVVEEDPYEQGRRAVLNLGHTAGHALERLSEYRLLHGEAVAIGMMVAAHISAGMGRCSAGLPTELEDALTGLGLPVTWTGPWDTSDVLGATAHDKKRRDGRQRWALPLRIGEVSVIDDVPEEIVRDALERTRAQ